MARWRHAALRAEAGRRGRWRVVRWGARRRGHGGVEGVAAHRWSSARRRSTATARGILADGEGGSGVLLGGAGGEWGEASVGGACGVTVKWGAASGLGTVS